ncbi:hypothetical protein BFW87_26860 [Pseudomonas fluorescens]|uniref:Uncharacterized protein n=1 Tax=Pseudomonas fluorescens TaxID=294 RepID=A0A1T2Y109_PSEFL|nr:hypothetical protein BFW87_26860 [Pseudomonas fluorescens]
MQIDLLNEPMLGHWQLPSGIWQCEFQFGSRLIYVQHRNGETPHARLVAVQSVVQAAWDDLPGVLKFAGQRCKVPMADVVALFERHGLAQSPLLVYSIHFELDKACPIYTLSTDPAFDWSVTFQGQEGDVCLAQCEPGEDDWFCVRRVGAQRFELEN